MKYIKTLLKSICVAFSIYSKIPMPRFEWGSDDMKYHFVFFPFVGGVLGFAEYIWFLLSLKIEVSPISFGLISFFLVILITGGLHLDGFMDTSDAIYSYGDCKKRLQILKDPHIGAFSVISLLGLFSVNVFAMSEIYRVKSQKAMLMCALGYALSRAAGAICVLCVKKAKSDGMGKSESDNSNKKISVSLLAIESLIIILAMIYVSSIGTLIVLITEIFFIFVYLKSVIVKFGGITGDLAGYFISMFETVLTISSFAAVMLGGV